MFELRSTANRLGGTTAANTIDVQEEDFAGDAMLGKHTTSADAMDVQEEDLAGDAMLGKHTTPADTVDVQEEDCASDAMLAKQATMKVAPEKALLEDREEEDLDNTISYEASPGMIKIGNVD